MLGHVTTLVFVPLLRAKMQRGRGGRGGGRGRRGGKDESGSGGGAGGGAASRNRTIDYADDEEDLVLNKGNDRNAKKERE